MDKVRFGVIGAGGIAERRTIPGMLLAKNATLTAVMDVKDGVAEKIAKKYDCKYFCDNTEELVKNPEVDAVYIASPVVFHAEAARLAADYGKHILIEKPIAFTSEEGRELVEYCEKKGVKIAAGFMMRFASHVQNMKNAVSHPKTAKQHKENILYCILGRTYECLLSLNTNDIIPPRKGAVKHLSGNGDKNFVR